ncbi:DUF1836 domain-containing protein [Salipaludibacillus daqingensis]|uniref:DUF1836 domain-containing protein n=1 Tax=Salipaludibacillus daqingensis TaxID=3041001 RepID=UPI00247448A2|nr:DUF1836 domain-containing protein [Salipaludibacillus daqingensis]
MKSLTELIPTMQLEQKITMEDIPDLDLYMDQVIQLFDRTFQNAKRNDKEKIITKTMINNYAKGGLLPPIKNKRYSKEHVMLISLIFELKGALSINDIKKTLQHINDKTSSDEYGVDDFYKRYLNIASENASSFVKETNEHTKIITEEVKRMEGDEYVQQVLMILSMITMSNFYRKSAEKLIDELPSISEI